MAYPGSGKAAKRYQSVGVASGIMDASPHRLVQMLLDGAVEKIAAAKGALERNDIPEKGRLIVWAVTIVGGLRASLDMDAGGEISANLEALYSYIERRLTEANLQNDPAALDEVLGLLGEIRNAWAAMPDEVKVPVGGAAAAQGSAG
jgi:flagellar protein FliS